MPLLSAGFWSTTYWAENYWNPRYWPKYSAAITPKLLNAGYWPTTYWVTNYWDPNYWLKYGTVTAPTPTVRHVGRKPRKKLSRDLKLALVEWLQIKIGD